MTVYLLFAFATFFYSFYQTYFLFYSTFRSGEDAGIAVAFDACWLKRGSGRAYNSKAGIGVLIGNTTKKVCAYGYRFTDCSVCRHHQSKGADPPPHDCNNNWGGSSKAMEPDIGVKLIQEVEEKGVRVDTLIMDDDTTTMARVRKEINHPVEKWSDTNHATRGLANNLYNLAKKHKILTNTNIKYIRKCFSYALHQNKGDVDKCRDAIDNIVPHCFGEHEKCNAAWCGAKTAPETYQHKTLLQDLSGAELRSDLASIFKTYSNAAAKLAQCGSTKECESFHNMLTSKASKRTHLCSTPYNLTTRIGLAVAQKNIGEEFIGQVNEKALLSPGQISIQFGLKKKRKIKINQVYANSPAGKRRRINGIRSNTQNLLAKEKREGPTYQSSIALTHHADNLEIPQNAPFPHLENVPTEQISPQCFVFCDIETGSLSACADILQISAVCGSETFDQYITPTKPVHPLASAVNQLSAKGRILFYKKKPVPSLPLKDALKQFLEWLQKQGPAILLIGHNFRCFDFPRLFHVLECTGLLHDFKRVCVGCVDSLLTLKEKYPAEESHKQEVLVKKFIGEEYTAHNALADVVSLQKLWIAVSPSESLIERHSFTVNSFEIYTHFEKEVAKNAATFEELVQKKCLSKAMAHKIGSTGLTLKHLSIAFSQGQENALFDLLTEKTVNNKARVTSSKKILTRIANFFKSVP